VEDRSPPLLVEDMIHNQKLMSSTIIRSSEVIESKTKTTLITEDPDDNKLLECAIDGRAKYIITGDKHLLKIRKYKNIRVVNPNSFLRKW